MKRFILLAAPLWMPFVFVALIRSVWSAAGAEVDPGASAGLSLFAGIVVGGGIALATLNGDT